MSTISLVPVPTTWRLGVFLVHLFVYVSFVFSPIAPKRKCSGLRGGAVVVNRTDKRRCFDRENRSCFDRGKWFYITGENGIR